MRSLTDTQQRRVDDTLKEISESEWKHLEEEERDWMQRMSVCLTLRLGDVQSYL